MKAITYSNARKNLRALIQNVCKDAEPTIIVSSKTDERGCHVLLHCYISDFIRQNFFHF